MLVKAHPAGHQDLTVVPGPNGSRPWGRRTPAGMSSMATATSKTRVATAPMWSGPTTGKTRKGADACGRPARTGARLAGEPPTAAPPTIGGIAAATALGAPVGQRMRKPAGRAEATA